MSNMPNNDQANGEDAPPAASSSHQNPETNTGEQSTTTTTNTGTASSVRAGSTAVTPLSLPTSPPIDVCSPRGFIQRGGTPNRVMRTTFGGGNNHNAGGGNTYNNTYYLSGSTTVRYPSGSFTARGPTRGHITTTTISGSSSVRGSSVTPRTGVAGHQSYYVHSPSAGGINMRATVGAPVQHNQGYYQMGALHSISHNNAHGQTHLVTSSDSSQPNSGHHHQQQQQQQQQMMISNNSHYNNFLYPTGGNNNSSRGTQTPNSAILRSETGGSASRVMRGDGVVVGTNSWVDESRAHVMSERVTETEVRVPKKIVREEVIEKVIVVPERLLREEMVEEVMKVRQKIIEVAKPVVQETIVEVPEIEFVERVVEYPEIVTQEKIREVPRIEVQENIIEIPKIVKQEKVVEIPEIEYVDVPYEKVVEVPEVREQVVVRPVRVPRYIEKAVPEFVDIEVARDVERSVPVPLEATVDLTLQLPRIRPRYTRVDVPLYVPRFVEIAVPVEMMDESMVANADHYAQQVHFLASQSAASLCELEKLGGTLKNADVSTFLHAFATTSEMCRFFGATWSAGKLAVDSSETTRLVSKPAESKDTTDTVE